MYFDSSVSILLFKAISSSVEPVSKSQFQFIVIVLVLSFSSASIPPTIIFSKYPNDLYVCPKYSNFKLVGFSVSFLKFIV